MSRLRIHDVRFASMRMAGGVLALALVPGGWAQDIGLPDQDRPATAPAMAVESPGAHLGCRVPPAIQADDRDPYADMLQLSPEQRVYFGDLYRKYADGTQEVTRAMWPSLMALNASASSGFEQGTIDPATVGLYAAYFKGQREMMTRLDDLESRMFAQLEAVLTQVQVDSLARVRLHRTRRQYFIPELPIRAASIDLAALVHDLPVNPAAAAAVDPILLEYEVAVTPLMAKLNRVSFDTEVKLRELEMRQQYRDNGERLEPGTAEAEARIREGAAGLVSLQAEPLRLQKRIAQVNAEFLPRISDALPAEQGRLLTDQYRQRAFPFVYPDVQDPAAALDQIQRSPAIPKDAREAIAGVIQAHRDEHEAICRKMEDEFMRWREELAKGSHPDFQSYRQAERAMRNLRLALDERSLKQVAGFLQPQERAALDNVISPVQHAIDDAKATFPTDNFPIG